MTNREKLAAVHQAHDHINKAYQLLEMVTPEVYQGKLERLISRCEDLIEETNSRILREMTEAHEHQRRTEQAAESETADPSRGLR